MHLQLRRAPRTGLALAAASAVLLAMAVVGCGSDETASDQPPSGGDHAATISTTLPSTSSTSEGPPTSSPPSSSPTTVSGGAPHASAAEVGLDAHSYDATACEGVDGSVIATLDNGTKVMLVREDGLALRLVTRSGAIGETDDVKSTSMGSGERYSGTVLLDGDTIDVSLALSTADYPDC